MAAAASSFDPDKRVVPSQLRFKGLFFSFGNDTWYRLSDINEISHGNVYVRYSKNSVNPYGVTLSNDEVEQLLDRIC